MKFKLNKADLKWYWQFVQPVKRNYLICLLLMLAQCVITLAVTAIQKFIIDDVIIAGNDRLLLWYVGSFIVLFVLFCVLYMRVARYVYLNRMDSKHLITKKLLHAILRLPQEAIQEERSATYVHHMTRDADKIAQVLSNRIPRGLQHVFYIVTIFIILGQMGSSILWVSTGLILVYFIVGRFTAPIVKRINRKVNDEKTELTVLIEEGIASTREVLSYNRQTWEMERYHKRFRRYFETVMTEGKKANLQIILTEPMKWGVHIAVLGFGGYAVINGTFSIGLFIVAYQFVAQLINSFQNLFNFSMDIIRGLASADRLKSVMNQAETEKGTLQLNDSITDLSFERVNFTYPGHQKPVLKDISFSIPKGKKVAFVGMSGGGKSTIIQLLLRFITPQQGHILVNGTPLTDVETEQWMKRIAIVFQEPYFFPETIIKNIQMGLETDNSQVEEVCAMAQIHQTIIDMPDGYESVLGERGITLSGGQRQRLALARALLRSPEILVLDEATSALDLETEQKIMQMLDQERQGKTTIISAHRLSTIQNADIIFVLEQGQIISNGSFAELMKTCHVFRRLVELDTQKQVG